MDPRIEPSRIKARLGVIPQADNMDTELTVRENLGLPDGFLDASPESPHLPVAVEALRRHRPELVLIPWVEERHPDHIAAGELLTRALFFAGLRKFVTGRAGTPFAPRQAFYYEMPSDAGQFHRGYVRLGAQGPCDRVSREPLSQGGMPRR
jgi:LmbE family N-acetylglucosaminyl deacetylase